MLSGPYYYTTESVPLIIKDIEKCLEAGAYLSALHSSLLLPDILGLALYGGIQSTTRYIKWVNNFYRDEFDRLPKDVWPKSNFPTIDGKLLYDLRCALLHEGHNNVLKKAQSNDFVIMLSPPLGVRGRAGSISDDKDNCLYAYIQVNAAEVSENMINSAKRFIKEHKDLNYPKIKIS